MTNHGEFRHKRKERTGIVVSDKMKKTIVVRVMRTSRHSKYNRTIRSTNKFKVHDENNLAKIGDLVKIQEIRPLSRDKRWRLVAVIKKVENSVSTELRDQVLDKE